MKKYLLSFAVVALLATACTKNDHTGGLDDSIVSSSNRHSTPEDNPNGGGGDNVNLTSIPTAVVNTFKSRYPNATHAEWKKQSDGTYKVEFFRGSIKWQAIFSASGRLLKE